MHQAATVLFTRNGLNNVNNNNNINVNNEEVDVNSASSSVVSTPRNSLREVRTAKFDVENDDDDNQVPIITTWQKRHHFVSPTFALKFHYIIRVVTIVLLVYFRKKNIYPRQGVNINSIGK